MMQVVDYFTTRDGEWYPSSKPYSITKEAAEKYAHLATGAAHHIFVRVPPSAKIVEFNTLDGANPVKMNAGSQYELIGTPIFQSYDPSAGDGPWHVWVDGQRITARGIGLPHNLHVSTFLVVEDDAAPDPVEPTPTQDKIQLIVNGKVVWSNYD